MPSRWRSPKLTQVRALAVLGLMALAAAWGATLASGPRAGAAPGPPAQLVTTTPTTEAPAPTAPAPTAAPATAAPATTPRTAPRTTVRRVTTTSGVPTTPPSTAPTTVAGTLPPTSAGNAPVASTEPLADAQPGEGKMPAWPIVLSGVGLFGTAGILGGQWMRTRSR